VAALLANAGYGATAPPMETPIPAADMAWLEHVESLLGADADPSVRSPEHLQPCVGGMAGGVYPCSNVDLVEFMPHSMFGTDAGDSVKTNSLWGWTDSLTGHEYVLLGLNNGTAFIDITDPENPVYVGKLPSHNGIVSTWRDVREHANHAYIVVDNGGAHGMQVFDLTALRDVAVPPVTFAETAHYNLVSNVHTISISKETGYAYLVGSNTCHGGLHIVNLASPASPQFVACYDDLGYVHENQCFIYHGPDTAYTGHEICLAARGSAHNLDVIDVTNHASPVRLDSFHYNTAGYSHQAWFTEDHRYILLNDELDESGQGHGTRTWIFDALDLDDLVPAGPGYHSHATAAIDHNLYVRGSFVFESNYRAGLRVLQLTDLDNAVLTEIGYFDLYPESDAASFNGAWNNYPFFASGVIPVSHIEQGLFLLRPTNLCADPAAPLDLTAGAGPADHQIDLAWAGTGTPGATYSVERALGGCSGSFAPLVSNLSSAAYSDTTASGLVIYGYRVREHDPTGLCRSAASACVEATATGSCTTAPAFGGIVQATDAGTATCSIELDWNPATPYCGGPVSYSIYRGAAATFVPAAANRIAEGITGTTFADTTAPPGALSHYVVRAVDTASALEEPNLVRRSATATGPPSDGTFTSGAEIGDPDLDTGDALIRSPEHAGWHITSDRAHTPSLRSFWSTAANNMCVTLEGSFVLSAGESSSLSFWTGWDVEPGWDGGVVDLSTNGGATWTRLTPEGGYPATITNGGSLCGIAIGSGAFTGYGQLDWVQKTIDLSAYAGTAVRLRWLYRTDTTLLGQGWYVDDIALTHSQVPGVCVTNVLFSEDFESGTFGDWTDVVP
jgi:choice-of-anchor B domain-containing protein